MSRPFHPSRRELLAGLGAAAALGATGLPGSAWALGANSQVSIAELDLGSGTVSRPTSWSRLLYLLDYSTSVTVNPDVAGFQTEPPRLRPEDPDLFGYPFVVCLGDGAFDLPSEQGLQQLARFLAYGGFLLFDDVTGEDDSGFDASVRRLVRVLFPTRSLAVLPPDHSIYRAFFLFQRNKRFRRGEWDGYPVGRLARHRELEGVTVGNLTPLVYTRNDLSGALETDASRMPRRACVPGGPQQRLEAEKLGMNLVMYSLTANYKKDQTHVSELIRRGQLGTAASRRRGPR